MDAFHELITFLESKVQNLNYMLKRESITIQYNLYPEAQSLTDQLVLYNTVQNQINQILVLLQNLAHFKKCFLSEKEKCIAQKTNAYLHQTAEDIVQNKEPFNEEHPLHGYKGFHDMLISMYAAIENYEKCNEVHKSYQNYELTEKQ